MTSTRAGPSNSWPSAFRSTGAACPHRLAELLSIAFDASFTHMYAPGTRRHIKAALKAGATMEEIMEVLKLCVIQGIEAEYGATILAKELEHAEMKGSVLSAGGHDRGRIPQTWRRWTRFHRAPANASRWSAKRWHYSTSTGPSMRWGIRLHQGSSLAAGKLDGMVVTCRSHGWRYDVTTGGMVNAPGYGVASNAVKVVDGRILVAVA